jgi:hypothetical protein
MDTREAGRIDAFVAELTRNVPLRRAEGAANGMRVTTEEPSEKRHVVVFYGSESTFIHGRFLLLIGAGGASER